MRDCSNAEMRDRLPDLLHGRLRGDLLAATRAHVDRCPDCRAERALLERARSAARTPPIDSARIVSALPRYRRVPAWRRAVSSARLQAAAAIILLVGGYAVMARPVSDRTPDSTRVVAAAPPTTPRPAAPRAATHELAIGDSFQDLSDSDLAAVLEELGKFEAVTPDANEEVLVPVLLRNNGGGGGA